MGVIAETLGKSEESIRSKVKHLGLTVVQRKIKRKTTIKPQLSSSAVAGQGQRQLNTY
jgi:hypothetical protein